MPKTTNSLWESIISWDNLYAAYLEARKGKRYKNQVLTFTENLEENLITLQNQLIWGTWRPHPFRCFLVKEPKPRQISAPIFSDRVVHHALVRVIEPYFERKFIHRSCACRKNKGTMFTIHEAWKLISCRSNTHVLKADIRSYFPSIQHDVLKRIMRRTIRDKKTLSLIDTIIDFSGDSGRGIPIGSLTSQLFANIYLDQLDHYATDELGYGGYIRYMDDFLVTGRTLAQLKRAWIDIDEYLNRSLYISLNSKTQIIPISHGIDYCGYRIFRHFILPRKRNVKRAKNRLRKLATGAMTPEGLECFKSSLMSFLGYMKHCRGYRTTNSVLEKITIGGEK